MKSVDLKSLSGAPITCQEIEEFGGGSARKDLSLRQTV
jgi:hypothetical protein